MNTVVGQRDLVPLANHIFPRFPGFSNSLELFMLPDYIICCDNFLEFDLKLFERNEQEDNCNFITVGSFHKTSEALLIHLEGQERIELIKADKKL